MMHSTPKAGFSATLTLLTLMLLASISGIMSNDWATLIGETLVGGAIMRLSAPWWAALGIILVFGTFVIPCLLTWARPNGHSLKTSVAVSLPAWLFLSASGGASVFNPPDPIAIGLNLFLSVAYGVALGGFSLPESEELPAEPSEGPSPIDAGHPITLPLPPLASNQAPDPLLLPAYGDSREHIRG